MYSSVMSKKRTYRLSVLDGNNRNSLLLGCRVELPTGMSEKDFARLVDTTLRKVVDPEISSHIAVFTEPVRGLSVDEALGIILEEAQRL